jgi:hypothetical protein
LLWQLPAAAAAADSAPCGSGGSVRRQHVSSASLHGEAANASPSNGAGDDALKAVLALLQHRLR